METQEIIQNNKLIAEFLGWKYHPETANHGMKDNTWEYKPMYYYHELSFHKSWDWLLPVVDKIEATELGDIYLEETHTNYFDASVEFEIIGNVCHVHLYGTMRKYGKWIYGELHSSKLEAVYRAVIDFITWYNQLPKK